MRMNDFSASPEGLEAMLGFFWKVAPGAFTLIAAVGGATHLLATVILRRRL
ncbi:hypothetical protein [Billgrantia endophytica]|uniref:hypothetical protein n=1 Tax=Billgrantia endophytica TaxID=2033802 RepID=UPI0013FDCB16|nr:hypothetical protein [Halomonas endophytica]